MLNTVVNVPPSIGELGSSNANSIPSKVNLPFSLIPILVITSLFFNKFISLVKAVSSYTLISNPSTRILPLMLLSETVDPLVPPESGGGGGVVPVESNFFLTSKR
ncbi:hypothetical protein D3C84_766780 [compost metagenome]